jgi:thymidylate synthase ThyX
VSRDFLHRPCARFTGEEPRNPIHRGPEGLEVTLVSWQSQSFPVMFNQLMCGAGDEPSRFAPVEVNHFDASVQKSSRAHAEQFLMWDRLDEWQQRVVTSMFAGRNLPTPMESIHFIFEINNVARATTHQLVRTRIGAAFQQNSGRVNDWRHKAWSMPETIARVVDDFDELLPTLPFAGPNDAAPLRSCITNRGPLEEYINGVEAWKDREVGTMTLRNALESHLQEGRLLYAALVDAGVPHQDARRVLTMGTETFIYDDYNYLALAGVLANRLEHTMEWEINAIAQLMVREVRMKCPHVFSQFLMSRSDKSRVCSVGDDSAEWSWDGKWPLPAGYVAPGPPSYGPLANPYFVLHPESLAGGPIRWIRTNGVFPWDYLNASIKSVCVGCGQEAETVDKRTKLCSECMLQERL